ncbi:MAG: glycosyltransferase family 9 protein [Chthoniobacterales bacterium]
MNFLLHPPRRILLIKPSSMGDVIHALPVAAALHQAWPKAEICWLIHPAFQDLVEHHPAVAKIILFPREEFRGVMGGVRALSWARTLCDWKPDLAIDLQGLLRSALMARASGARYRIGLSDAREGAGFCYSNIAKVDRTSHAVTRYMQVLKTLGISYREPQFDLPKGSIPPGFSLTTPFVVIHPYARGEGKNLTQEQVLAFAETLHSFPVVLVGQGEKMECLPDNVLDWSGRTSMLELIGLLRQASFVVSSDSGPMHLAAALQPERLIAIHRWSDPLRVGPWPQAAFVWKNGKLKSHGQLTEEARSPGRTPTLEEMRALGTSVLKKLK